MATMRWGDTLEDDDFDEVTAQALVAAQPAKPTEVKLPPRQVFGPDKDGVKMIVEYKVENGQKMKVTKKVRISKQQIRTTKGVIERRQLKKFGEAANLNAEQERTTMALTEDIFLERVKTSKENTRKDESFDQLQALATTKALMRMSGLSDKPDALAGGAYKVPAAARLGGAKPPEEMESAAALAAAKANGSYVPIHLRAGSGAMGESMKTRRDENSIRVTNLSEDTKEQDLVELFRPFGPISRIYIAYDRDTRESRGFAFINFIHRDDADRAISKLDGYGYDNLILRVEWAAPREPKP